MAEMWCVKEITIINNQLSALVRIWVWAVFAAMQFEINKIFIIWRNFLWKRLSYWAARQSAQVLQ